MVPFCHRKRKRGIESDVADVWGIGHAINSKLRGLGIQTAQQIRYFHEGLHYPSFITPAAEKSYENLKALVMYGFQAKFSHTLLYL